MFVWGCCVVLWLDLSSSFLGFFRASFVCAIVPPADYLEICLLDSGGLIAFASRLEVSF